MYASPGLCSNNSLYSFHITYSTSMINILLCFARPTLKRFYHFSISLSCVRGLNDFHFNYFFSRSEFPCYHALLLFQGTRVRFVRFPADTCSWFLLVCTSFHQLLKHYGHKTVHLIQVDTGVDKNILFPQPERVTTICWSLITESYLPPCLISFFRYYIIWNALLLSISPLRNS